MAEEGADRVESEAEIISAYMAPLAAGFGGALGLTDDCAVLSPPPGGDLVLTTDSMIEGVHFRAGDIPAYKALAANVSDLAAKGARPLIYLLTLALPRAPERRWLAAFTAELATAQAAFGCHLAGGDTDRTPGPLTVTIAAIGVVPEGAMVRRSTASAGDLLCVTGTIGDAMLGLRLACEPALAAAWGLDDAGTCHLGERLARPTPRHALAAALRACASACIDVSDGLVKDLRHLCGASGLGARVELAEVPLSPAARQIVDRGGAGIEHLISGGEDYELLMAVPPSRLGALREAAAAAGIGLTAIGALEQGADVVFLDQAGARVEISRGGWEHFEARRES